MWSSTLYLLSDIRSQFLHHFYAYCMWQHSTTMHGVFQNLTFPHLKRNYKMVAYSLKMYHFNNTQALVNNFKIDFTLT